MNIVDCPCCDSNTIELIGVLGDLAWFRCQGCGIEFSVPEDEAEELIIQDQLMEMEAFTR